MGNGYNSHGNMKIKFKFKCHRCREIGHKAADCKNKKKINQASAKHTENVSLCVMNVDEINSEIKNTKWCLDSGATSHLCNNTKYFSNIINTERGTLNLANNESTEIVGKGTALFNTRVFDEIKNISLKDTLHANLLSISKITDNNCE